MKIESVYYFLGGVQFDRCLKAGDRGGASSVYVSSKQIFPSGVVHPFHSTIRYNV